VTRPRPATLIVAAALVLAIMLVEAGVRDPSPGIFVAVPPPSFLAPLVEQLRAVPLAEIHDSRAAAVASGVLFGRTEHVTPADQQSFLSSGLWHLLAASGQNIALVAACCILLARGLGAGRTTGSVLALLAIPAYVMVVGGGASIVRAGIMGELGILAWLFGRLPDVRHLLLVVAAAICWIWPGAHRGLGMQLSFACVAALALWAVPATRRIEASGVPSWLAGALVATGLCSVVTAPILVLRTGAAPLLGIVANVLAVPLAGVLLVVGLAGSAVALAGDALGQPDIGRVAMLPSGLLARLLLDIATRAATLPAAQTSSRVLAIGVPACLAVLLLGPRRIRRLAIAGVVTCMLLPLAAATLDASPLAAMTGTGPPPLAEGSLRIASLDIGQGDSTLVQEGDAAILVDVGPPDGHVVDRVHELGVDHVDGVVLTHDSLDHRGGFDAVLASLHPDWVAMPRLAPGPWQRIRDLAPNLVELCAGSHIMVGDARLDVLHPRCDGTIVPHTGDLHNDGAMVILVQHGSIRAVLPADAEAPVLVGLGLPHLDLLRVSHHGSADPSLPELLARTSPAVASISVGAGNDYGHPRASTLEALRAAGVRTLRTDRDGTIVFDSDGEQLRLVG
jgi:competence protein ComEC